MNIWVIIIIAILVIGYLETRKERKEADTQDRIDDLENRINDIEDFIGLDEESLKMQKEIKMDEEMSELANNLPDRDKNQK